jgi:N-glycosylase/DNA lyase
MRNIELMLSRLASHLGVRHDLNGRRLYGLPSPAAVAKSGRRILTECGLGYRAEAVLRAACSIRDGNFDLGRIKMLNYDSAHRTLAGESQNTPHPYGVGPKVADCILLFAFEMLEAFPIDMWIARAINKYYDRIISKEAANALRRHVDRTGTLTRTRYREISRAMRNYFGEYAGQAQQHLFIASRSNVI